jgi:glycine cleavage system regulatory protein
VAVAAERIEALQMALKALPGLTITLEQAGGPAAGTPARTRRLAFSLVGHDRLGIVREISQVFARYGVNVEKLVTSTTSAPMSSETLFRAEAELKADDSLDAQALQADLERLSNDLIADINLDEKTD